MTTTPATVSAAAARSPYRTDLRAGVLAMLPLLVAYVPFGLMVGAAVASSANPPAAWLATWTIYGGAAHLAVLDVLGQGSGWLAATAVGLLVNARLTAYAAAMAPAWRSAPATQRAAAALVLTDAPWALARGRVVGQRPFYLGAALTLFLVWPVLVSVGVLVGGWFTAHAVTALLPALTLGTVVVTQLGERPVLAAVSCAAVTAAATAHLPAGVSLLGCAVTGVLAATVAERLR